MCGSCELESGVSVVKPTTLDIWPKKLNMAAVVDRVMSLVEDFEWAVTALGGELRRWWWSREEVECRETPLLYGPALRTWWTVYPE